MKITKTKSKGIKPLPFGVYLWTVILITMIGLTYSIYLSVSHYRVYTDIGYKSFCAISRAINCDTISQSFYSIFFKPSGTGLGRYGLWISIIIGADGR